MATTRGWDSWAWTSSVGSTSGYSRLAPTRPHHRAAYLNAYGSPALVGSMSANIGGINKMELFRPVPCGDSRAGHGATNKATMCLEINRCAIYVPIPKQMRCTPHQGFGKPKATGHGWKCVSYHVWNKRDGAISANVLPTFSGGPAGYDQSHDVS